MIHSLCHLPLLLAGSFFAEAAFAQPWHRLQRDDAPPGAIGQSRRDLRGPVDCKFQPVKITAEGDARVSLAQGNMFQPAVDDPVYVGLSIGNVYRIRITDIPLRAGYEVFPTIELIDRVYPPKGQEVRFAVPINISEEDVELAITGQLVTRVIYLEDPDTALPLADPPASQRNFDIRPNQDALEVADSLGRPVAIIRYGSRVPPTDPNQMHTFLMGCPYWLPLAAPRTEAIIPEGQTAAVRTPHIPRVDLPAVAPIPATPTMQFARPLPTSPRVRTY